MPKNTLKAAVLKVLRDPNDMFFKLAVTLPDEKISDQPCLRNPEIDGSPNLASTRILPLGASQCIRRFLVLPMT